MSEPACELILYRGDEGESQVQLRVVGGTVWLQAQAAESHSNSRNAQPASAGVHAGEEATSNSKFAVRPVVGHRQARETPDGRLLRTNSALAVALASMLRDR